MLIVETLESDGAATKAGIEVEDRLLTYAGQPLLSLALLQALEENPTGVEPVRVQIERAGQQLDFVVAVGKLGLQVRPWLPSAELAQHAEARAHLLAGGYAEAARTWEALADRLAGEVAEPSAWLLSRAGEAWDKAREWPEALRVYVLAWERLAGSGDTALQSQVARAMGHCHQSRSEWAPAQAWYERALRVDEQAGRGMWQSVSLHSLGNIAYSRGDLEAARDYNTRALTIFEHLAPGSLEVAASLGNLGKVAYSRGDLEAAQDYVTRALTIRERLAPGSLEVAASLNNLGIVALDRGDLEDAQDYYTRALMIREHLAPGSLEVAASLNNLGLVAHDRGDLEAAQDYYTRALTIEEHLAPGSQQAAKSLNNLGSVAYSRGDLEAAQDYFTRALTTFEHLAPGSLDVATCLNNLGNVAGKRGDLEAAWDYHARALTIREHLAPGSLDVAMSLGNLGTVARNRGDLEAARDYHTRALMIREHSAPNSLDHSASLSDLGQTLLLQHRPDQALPFLQQAVQILEQQRATIAAPETRALLLAQHTPKFARLLHCYLALNQPDDAFATLERSRARSLLELFALKRLDLAEDVPASLLEQQQTLDKQREHTYNQLTRLSASNEDREQVEALHRQLRALDRQQKELSTSIRAASPRYAALQYPQPLSLPETQAALQPTDVLLSYLVDEEQTFLFAVTHCNVQAFTLPLGAKTLQQKVHALRSLLDWRLATNRIKANVDKAIDLGRQLYADLIQPAATKLGTEPRLLLCADGPLHILPFAALVTNLRGKPRYLGAARPLKSILSATLYAQGREDSPLSPTDSLSERTVPATLASQADLSAVEALPDSSAPASFFRRLLALGDPLYSLAEAAPAGARSRSASPASIDLDDAETILQEFQSRGLSLGRLPHTRTEVLALKRLFGERAIVKLGAEATKTVAFAESAQVDVLHFACHAFLDAKLPLHSGLVLSRARASEEGKSDDQAQGDNGLLQVWEVFQKLRLDADLVVLSACETGLGEEVRGEGLVGLARAFSYAGARNLVVSLWEVNDASTSVFMQGFYQTLKDGRSKEEAMRAGIAVVRKRPEWQAPYFWSGFVLLGSRT